ncbi:MAG: AAA family ATPase [Chloroflexaceae bacterium]|nr:AAA family ATPase [Chloroflexaceae bacterium]
MVYVKRIELSHFKSFGGTTKVPFLPGFTVISGPNGSGKSNILDALLFCLGLASSKGMRAERLPDLINHKYAQNHNAAETSVSVTFDLSDLPELVSEYSGENGTEGNGNGHNGNGKASETFIPVKTSNEGWGWTVTRRLRVGKGGNYSSTYYINGEVCTANELHEQLNRLRIYPEGYNVVLQGDVTRIINMNARERREIIDELAGVAAFDRKIEKTKETLESVRETEERCHIIEQELIASRDKLAGDRLKAEKYQQLKLKIVEKQQQEAILSWHLQQLQRQELQGQIQATHREIAQLNQQLAELAQNLAKTTSERDELNRRVKALGEEEQLAIAAELANQKAKQEQLQQRQQELASQIQQSVSSQERYALEIQQFSQKQGDLHRESEQVAALLPGLTVQRDQSQTILAQQRQQSDAIAVASEAFQQEQMALNRKITEIQMVLNPLQTEQAQLLERRHQLEQQLTEQGRRQELIQADLQTRASQTTEFSANSSHWEQQRQAIAPN